METSPSCQGLVDGRGPKLKLGDIFRSASESYRAAHRLTPEQAKVFKAIEVCRTAALGGRIDECQVCAKRWLMYHSCRDRHCPNCQALASAKWLAAREQTILPTHYYHVVFTLPRELRRLVKANSRALYGLLLRCSAQTLQTLGADEKWLGAQVGCTAVLHTWTRDLRYHPHAHVIVTGGGLSPDGTQWVESSKTFLFPVKVMGSVFRGKFLDGLNRLHRRGELKLPGDWDAPGAFYDYTVKLAQKAWVVYCKRPFAGARQVYAYLGRYTHRVGLSNYRLQAFDGQMVTFKTRGSKAATLPTDVFISRFLQHVLPKGFTRLRHYGLLAPSNVHTRLKVAQQLLGGSESSISDVARLSSSEPDSVDADPWRELASTLLGSDLCQCPECGEHAILSIPLDPPRSQSRPRGPPNAEAP